MSRVIVSLDQLDYIVDNTTVDENDVGTNDVENDEGVVTLAASFLLYEIGKNFLCLNNVFFLTPKQT